LARLLQAGILPAVMAKICQAESPQMSIQKKSLISTLKTAKKANVASSSTHEVDAKGARVSSMRMPRTAGVSMKSFKFKA
jgi:hypothetical protein